jgi:hypothetical protein
MLAPNVLIDDAVDRFAKLLALDDAERAGLECALATHNGFSIDELQLEQLVGTPDSDLLVFHDRDDREVSFQHGERLAAQWPGARLVAPDGLGHRRILRDDAVVRDAVAFASHGVRPPSTWPARRHARLARQVVAPRTGEPRYRSRMDLWQPRPLGRTGLRTSRLGLGSSYGVSGRDVDRAIERGVNYLYWGSVRRPDFGSAITRAARRDRARLCVVIRLLALGLTLGPSLELAPPASPRSRRCPAARLVECAPPRGSSTCACPRRCGQGRAV